ncbi:MAG: DUF1614 domain-containing protein [Beijerinckiaceae bacterium]
MQSSPNDYLPLSTPFFSVLVLMFVATVVVIEIRALRYAFTRIGIGSRVALLLLFASLLGSYINVPVAKLPGIVIAVNVGGAVIPVALSLYLLIKNNLWIRGFIATACVAAIVHYLAYPVAGAGIVIPVFVPPIATAVVCLLISRHYAAPLAYISGSLGTLIGADLLNLDKVQGLGEPVASIGGAGTFDGIFITGIVAVLLASFIRPGEQVVADARHV